MKKTNVAVLDTLTDTQIVEQCLEKIEARCRNTLKQAGYSTDPDTFSQDDRWWDQLNRRMKGNRKPSSQGQRSHRAVAALLLMRQLREALTIGDIGRAARLALAVGPFQEDILTDALTLLVNRAKSFRKANVARRSAKQDRVKEAQRLAKEINDERTRSDQDPSLGQPSLAAYKAARVRLASKSFPFAPFKTTCPSSRLLSRNRTLALRPAVYVAVGLGHVRR